MKKIISLTLILVVMMTLISNVYAASSYKLSLEPSKSEVSKGEQFTVDVKISDIQDENGIIALGAKLEYDETSLELVEMQGVGKWSSPSYNELNGEFATDRNGNTIGNETIFRITFKVTEQSKQDFEISLKNISASNGNEDIKIEDVKTEMSLKNTTSNPDDIIPTNPNENNTNDPFISIDDPETPNGVGNNISNGTLTNQTIPDTGSSNSMLAVLIGVAGILAVVSFVRMRKNEEIM